FPRSNWMDVFILIFLKQNSLTRISADDISVSPPSTFCTDFDSCLFLQRIGPGKFQVLEKNFFAG
ncbi:TPA: hypothetical protein ACGW3Q_006595, partial [Pseudomonas aeruginosa]